MTAVPPQAITAAAAVLSSDPGDRDARTWAKAILEAAAPHLAAAEREHCAQLADDEAATLAASEGTGHRALRRFAALLRESAS